MSEPTYDYGPGPAPMDLGLTRMKLDEARRLASDLVLKENKRLAEENATLRRQNADLMDQLRKAEA